MGEFRGMNYQFISKELGQTQWEGEDCVRFVDVYRPRGGWRESTWQLFELSNNLK